MSVYYTAANKPIQQLGYNVALKYNFFYNGIVDAIHAIYIVRSVVDHYTSVTTVAYCKSMCIGCI